MDCLGGNYLYELNTFFGILLLEFREDPGVRVSFCRAGFRREVGGGFATTDKKARKSAF